MAAGSSEVASPNTELGKKDMAELHRVLYPARNKCIDFGLQIGLDDDEIENIESNKTDSGDRLRAILRVRLNEAKPLTWNEVYSALRSKSVGKSRLAEGIRRKYGHLFINEEEHEIKSKEIIDVKKSAPKTQKGDDHWARVSKEGERSSEYEGIETVRSKKHVQEVESEDEEDSVLSRKEKKALSTKGNAHDRVQAKGMNKKDKFTKDESHSEPEVREMSKQKKKATTDQEEEKIESEDEDIGYTGPEEAITESESEISSERETLDLEICQFPQRKELLHAKAEKSEHYELSVQNPKRLKVEETQSSSRDSNKYSSRRKFVTVKGSIGRKGKSRRSAGVKVSRAYEAQREKKNAGNNPKYSEMKPVQSVVTKPVQSVVTEAPFLGKKSRQHSLPKQEMKGEYTSKDSSSSEEEMQSSSLVLSRPSTSRSVLGGIEESTERSDSESYSSREQEEPDPRGKRRRRKRIRETSDTPLASDPPSYPTSENETRRKCYDNSEWQGRKSKHARYQRKGRERHRERGRQESSSSSSDSADSSPECDRNLSVSERRKLKRLFKCAFGRLCRAITNPDEVAVELQAKRLLSRSATEMILTSPESKQGKAIFLVRALARRIKPRPDRVFTAIEVFLSSEGLQDIGAEMKIKAGNVCDEKAAPSSGSQSLPPQTELTSLSDRKGSVCDTQVTMSPPTTAPTSAVIRPSSSVVVSQPVPQSGLSPVLAQYRKYLQFYYNARALAPADKYLPTLDSPYINLAMISRSRHHDRGERDEFTLKTLHGGVDQILESKSPINIEDLLSSGSSGKPVRFILVEGPPGIGKSTFAWEVCRRWDEIESLRDYHTVVMLKLREKWVLNATSLSDLFRYPFQPEFSRDIAREVHESHGQNLLLVLDGFDEVSHSFHENSVIKSILCRQLLPECTVILTTRPSAKATLESVCQPPVDKHVEIIGFTEEERVRYITEVFSKEPELQVNFLKYMFLVPHIKSMMYIPLNCAIIAQVYSESQSSHHLAIPRTRTQLYKALTHSLLVRHMKMKEGNPEYTSMLPEGLNKEEIDKFKVLAKFAFVSYHTCESKKVTFFKEDIPEGLVYFGFMNESTEMYAGKGVEQTFSFLHLSLQEYLAAWHIAHSYSIEFQVSYHGLAVKATGRNEFLMPEQRPYRGSNREEEVLLSSLKPLGESLVEPAIFLAGITGWRCQSEDGRNHWEMHLSHDTAGVSDPSVLLCSLYEAQNPTILSHYFNADSDRREIGIGHYTTCIRPYDCYTLSYCLAHSSDEFKLSIDVSGNDDVSLVETFVKGLEDHCKPTSPPTVRHLRLQLHTDSFVVSERCLFWLAKVELLPKVELVLLETEVVNSVLALTFLQSHLQSLGVLVEHITSWEWLATLRSLRELKSLRISSDEECSPPPSDLLLWLVEHRLTEVGLDIELPSNSAYYCVCSSIDALVGSLFKHVLRSNQITKISLSNISRETVAGVHSVLLHCPSLTSLELKRTRLGYDGILHICRALRNNTTLKHLLIHDDDLQVPPSRNWKMFSSQFTSFLSMERVALPSKTTCTDFLLELDNILKTNTTLEEMKIQSGLFFPLSADEGREYCQWTGLGPLQQFNVGAVGSGRSPNLRRSYSSSDLTQPQTLLFWDRQFYPAVRDKVVEVDFKKIFSLKKEKGEKLFSLPSFTAPDTEVLQSFSGLDPRLKDCLEISDLNQYVKRLREWSMMSEVSVAPKRHIIMRHILQQLQTSRKT